MKAAVLHEYGKPLVIEEVDIDPPQKGEVQIRLVATAICHSDIHTIRGDMGGPPLPPSGRIVGHEVAGIVEKVGESVTSVKPGDHVLPSYMAWTCGKCRYCLDGSSHQCLNRPPMSKENSGIRDKKGNIFPQGVGVNGFAEYSNCDEGMVVKIPEDMPLDRACLLTCGFLTGFGAVVNRAQVRPMRSVVVMGIGGVGINAIQGAVFSGAYPIIAVDTLDTKLEIAREFGAHYGVNATKPDAIDQVKNLTVGLGADYVFVTVGSAAAIRQGFLMLAVKGMEVNIGLVPAGQTITFEPMEFTFSEKILTGCFMGSNRFHVDIPHYIELYKAGLIKLDELITGRYPLEKINEAVESTERGEAIRNVIIF
jgi:S-(hydroxymethyl)glutathione dehydrogenase/alcohol dehydrogenase